MNNRTQKTPRDESNTRLDKKSQKDDTTSVYSAQSRTSSIFSTASKLSKIPNAVKTSVKYLVKRNKKNDSVDQPSFASKIKRSTFHFISRNKDTSYTTPSTMVSQRYLESHAKKEQELPKFIPSDSKSEKMLLEEKPAWTRKRAKSCQENKPMLRHLASKGSFHQLPLDTIPSPTKSMTDLPLFKGLVTTTLTTLNTRLMNECDRALSTLILNPEAPIQEQLLSIISDLCKMSEMVNWQNEESRKLKVKENIQTLEHIILHQELTLISVKDIIYIMKQVMNQCICQYYKVVEKAIVIPSKGYRIEGINKFGKNTMMMQPQERIDYTVYGIDHQDAQAHWYRTYFTKDVSTLFGYNKDQEPILLSIQTEEEEERFYRLIYRTKHTTEYKRVPDSFLFNEPQQFTTSLETMQETTWKTLIESNFPDIPYYQLMTMEQDQLISSGIHEEILRLDENALHRKYKFGVLFIKDGQTKEEEWFANEHDSESFERFLNIIGRKTLLKGYTGWAAGLDTKSNDSGEYTYTNHWNENQIAYHVSTLIPSKLGDKQQIQRKRHIGNDIVCLVFIEGNQPFNPAAIKSQFLHVFIIVHEETWSHDTKAWRVEIVSVVDVPEFGPPLPEQAALFLDERELEAYLLAKLVNAEYAAFKSPKFATPMTRAREGIFANLVEKGFSLIQEKEPIKKHTKSLSTSSSHSSLGVITPTVSKSSNAIREISENMVLTRRKSAHELNDKSSNKNWWSKKM